MLTGLMVARMQPLHLGHVGLINKALSECDILFLAIGSAQDDLCELNPFTYNRRYKMVCNIFGNEMKKNLHVFPVIDIGNSTEWANHVMDSLADHFAISKPTIDIYFAGTDQDALYFSEKGIKTSILRRELTEHKSGTEIREMIWMGNIEWKKYVPKENWNLIKKNK